MKGIALFKKILYYSIGGSEMELAFLKFLTHPIVVWVLELRVISWVLGLFLPFLERNDKLPNVEEAPAPCIIYLISYAATRDGLTRMSLNTTKLAKKIANMYPEAVVVGCAFRDNPLGADEWGKKREILAPNTTCLYAGKASSTTDERELIMAKIGHIPKSGMVVVGGGAHIRRASMVIEHYHPEAKIFYRSTDSILDADPENPMLVQRRWQTWVVANIVGIIFYKTLGVAYFAKKNLSQPV